MSIQEHLNKIRNAIYGREVRESIAKGIETAYDDASEKDNANMEVKIARGTNPNLNTRLNKMDATDRQTTKKIDSNYNEVTAQLAQTHKKDEQTVDWRNLTQNARDQVTGDTPPAYVGRDSVSGKENIIDDSVIIDNLEFTKKSTNLYNDEIRISNHYVVPATGELVAHNSFDATGKFIKVKPNTTYWIKDASHIVFYDRDGERLSQHGSHIGEGTFTTPANCYNILFSWGNISEFKQQLNLGEEELPYEPFYHYIDSKFVETKEVATDDILNEAVTVEKTNFVVKGKNIFNSDNITNGKFINQNDGTLANNISHWVSDEMPVKSGETYTVSRVGSGSRIAYYDKFGLFLKGEHLLENSFNIPDDGEIIRISNASTIIDPDGYQVEKGDSFTGYESYGVKIPKLIGTEDNQNELEINLPRKIYGLVEQELNIYFDNIINGDDTDYDFDVNCAVGEQLENRFRLVTEMPGEYEITIDVLKDKRMVATTTSEIVIVDSTTGDNVEKNVLLIGDSTTANGIAVSKLNEDFSEDVMDIKTIGTEGEAPNKHEGRSGWSTSHYMTDERSPFLFNGTFDFSQYMVTNNLAVPDYVIINLGINDMFNGTSNIEQVLGWYQDIIDSIHNYNTNIKIGLALTIPPAYSQDAFGRSYGAGRTRNEYKGYNFEWVKSLIERFDKREGELIYLVPIHTNLDTRHNYPFDWYEPKVPVNARNTDVMVDNYAKNAGVHPAESGYWQIADVYWYWLKSFES